MQDQGPSSMFSPQPRRPANLSLTPISSTPSNTTPSEQTPVDPDSPGSMESRTSTIADSNARAYASQQQDNNGPGSLQQQQKSRSIVNLTSSTLFGIYSPSGYEPNRDEPLTPFGTGAQTPARSTSVDMKNKSIPTYTAQAFKEKAAIGKERRDERRKSVHMQRQQWRRASVSSRALNILLRTTLLFAFGLAYGEAITQLHNSGRVAPVQVHRINRASWFYLAFWGTTGVLLGFIVPYMDTAWVNKRSAKHGREDDDYDDTQSEQESAITGEDETAPVLRDSPNRLAADWSDIVRSIGAFVGIAFAIRKLSWQSTLQVSLTLALVNPVMWYLIDRTCNGFVLSSACGILGASVLLGINPDWIPAPATSSPTARSSSGQQQIAKEDLFAGMISYESIGVATWVASVLFCSCIFFGNVGRRLRPGD